MVKFLRELFSKSDVKLHSYTKPDGSFDYDSYRAIQESGNKKKIDQTWAHPENIAFLSRYIKERLPNVEFGICHGTRRGSEQKWFREHLHCEVIGTEIASTASQFPHTVQWDFHEINPAWIGKTDFIYSNSFDHAYDPKKALNAWMGSLKPDGLCILEHGTGHEPKKVSALDPFGAKFSAMPALIREWSEGRFAVADRLKGVAGRSSGKIWAGNKMRYLVIKNIA